MPLGDRALNPATPYYIYEFAYGAKVFYVGISHSTVRMYGRWTYVNNLVKQEDAGTLKPAKAKSLATKSNQVIATLIRSGLPEFEVRCAWTGDGKKAAEYQEKIQIQRRLAEKCLLANQQHNTESETAAAIVAWITKKT